MQQQCILSLFQVALAVLVIRQTGKQVLRLGVILVLESLHSQGIIALGHIFAAVPVVAQVRELGQGSFVLALVKIVLGNGVAAFDGQVSGILVVPQGIQRRESLLVIPGTHGGDGLLIVRGLAAAQGQQQCQNQ